MELRLPEKRGERSPASPLSLDVAPVDQILRGHVVALAPNDLMSIGSKSMKWPWWLSWSVGALGFLIASPTRLAARIAQSSVPPVSSGIFGSCNQANQMVGTSTAIGFTLTCPQRHKANRPKPTPNPRFIKGNFPEPIALT
jgi:hypothetical protein